MRSGIPPAFAPTTGTPLAIDSRTTNPSVSESDGIMNTSAEANAWLNASPVITPVRTVFVPAKWSLSASASGPVPTNANRAFGILPCKGKSSLIDQTELDIDASNKNELVHFDMETSSILQVWGALPSMIQMFSTVISVLQII